MDIKHGDYVEAARIHDGEVIDGIVYDLHPGEVWVLADGVKWKFAGHFCTADSAKLIQPEKMDDRQRKHWEWWQQSKQKK